MDRTTALTCVLAVSLAAATIQAQSTRRLMDAPEVRLGAGLDPMLLEGPGQDSGATVRELRSDEARKGWLGRGVVVQRVNAGSPAARAKLEAGDVVIEIDGVPVTNAKHFSRLVRHTPPGRAVPVEIVRQGLRSTLTLTL